jgi:hypothetical protein
VSIRIHRAASTGPHPPGIVMLASFRFLAAVLLLIAVLAAVYDGTRSLNADTLVVTPLAEHWKALAPTLLENARAGLQRSTHPLVWDMGVARLLALPTWGIFAGLGLILAYAGRRRRRINVFAN